MLNQKLGLGLVMGMGMDLLAIDPILQNQCASILKGYMMAFATVG